MHVAFLIKDVSPQWAEREQKKHMFMYMLGQVMKKKLTSLEFQDGSGLVRGWDKQSRRILDVECVKVVSDFSKRSHHNHFLGGSKGSSWCFSQKKLTE